MRRTATARRGRTYAPQWRRALAVLCLVVPLALPGRAQSGLTCPGDCSGDGFVRVNELVIGVDIALGTRSVTACPSVDSNGSGAVTISELVQAVLAALNGCGFAARGMCLRPGANGLEPCDEGTPVRVMRCDDRERCLESGGATVLDFGTVGAGGRFTLRVDPNDIEGATLVFEADVEPVSGTTYRVLDFGPVGARAESGASAGAAGELPLQDVVIDPVSEAAVRIVDENGLENFNDVGVEQVAAAVRDANANTSFAGREPAEAATAATDTARQDPTVMTVVAMAMFTPTPAALPTPTPTRPQRFVYVSNREAQSVSVVDAVDNTVVATIPVGADPEGVAVSPDGSMVFVANAGSDTITVIDPATRQVAATIPDPDAQTVDNPFIVAVARDGERVYVTNNASMSVSVIDARLAVSDPAHARVRTLAVGRAPLGVALARTGVSLFVSNFEDDTLSVVAAATGVAGAPVAVGRGPALVALSPDDSVAYVSNQGAEMDGTTVTIVDVALAVSQPGLANLGTIEVGRLPAGIAFAPNGARAYVANASSQSVSVIDTVSRTVVTTIPLGAGATPVIPVLSTDGRRLYVTALGRDALFVIDTERAVGDPVGAVLTAVPVGTSPQSAAFVELP